MIPGTFERRLRQLNKNLRIFCGDDNSKPAGLYRVVNGEYINVCSVDKNFVPRRMVVDSTNHVIKSGWNRVVKLLIRQGLVKKSKAEDLFGRIDYHLQSFTVEEDKLKAYLGSIEDKSSYKHGIDTNGNAVLDKKSVLDMSAAIRSGE